MSRFALVLVLFGACTKHNPDVCTSDADCTDPGLPFCDIDGQYPESSYQPNSCSAKPATCPVSRCGCTPGESLACTADQVTVCAPDGMSTVMETCALGCAATEPRCATFDPSNDLGPALADAATQPDIVIPKGSHIDTELGLVQDPNGGTIALKSVLVSQNGGSSMIRAFEANSFIVDDVTVAGTYALAMVAHRGITLRGHLDASATLAQAGPGAQESPAVCAGQDSSVTDCLGSPNTPGAGGAGNATMGAAGGYSTCGGSLAGALIPSFVPLVGGCRGGNVLSSSQVLLQHGGGGGGAVQLVSLDVIALIDSGVIDVTGGGAGDAAGGGSGGLVILEAPHVRISGSTTGVVSNGGAGGGCGSSGPDGQLSNTPAQGPQCNMGFAGNGGTMTTPPTAGYQCTAGGGGVCSPSGTYGGGGGAVGRLHIVTSDAGYETTNNPLLSTAITTASLIPR